MKSRMAVVGVVGVVVAMLGVAVQPDGAKAQQPPVFKAGVELVTVDATVVDRNGRPVEGLKADDFTVTVDGKPRRVVTVEFTRFDQRPPTPNNSQRSRPSARPLRPIRDLLARRRASDSSCWRSTIPASTRSAPGLRLWRHAAS